jgi:hypothetical protein
LNITVAFEGFSEREREEPDEDYVNGSCDPTWDITDPQKRYFYRFVDELDCERNSSHYYLSPEARVDFISLNYTDPTLPGFWLAITVSTTTEEFTVYPSNDTTFVDPGQEYKWVYRYGATLCHSWPLPPERKTWRAINPHVSRSM